jgi:hypothetical protein
MLRLETTAGLTQLRKTTAYMIKAMVISNATAAEDRWNVITTEKNI